jgi:serralysin
MKSRFISDPQDPFGNGVLNMAEDAANTNFFPASFITAATHGGGTPPASAAPVISPDPFPIVPAETLEAQAAQNGPGGPGSVVAVTSATGTGITFNLVFDAAAMAATSAATAFRAGIQQAASILSATITDNITITLNIDYSGTGGGAAAGPDTGLYVNYSTVRADLVNNATKGDPTLNALPTGSTIQGQSQVAVWDAQLKLFGLALPSNYSGADGTATFATDINPSLLVGVALHELTHALGRVPYGSQPDIFDFFRSTSPGTELFSGNIPVSAAYFSVDGGYTKLADYGQNSDPSDFLNSGVQGGRDSFNEFYTSNTLQSLTAVDKEQLDALGFHLASPLTTTIQTDTNTIASTSLVKFFNNYYLENAGSGVGPELKIGGAPFVAGQGIWVPIGAVQTATGYEVAWKETGVDMYSVWATDSNGNYLSSFIPPESGFSASFEAIEISFHQDLNGDGVISSPTPIVVESFGSTSLMQIVGNYFLYPNGGSSGPEVELGGTPIAASSQAGAWVPIGAEATASGYEIAWKVIGADQYAVWNADSNGNYVSTAVGTTSGSSLALESIETSFHQDLNGDGVVGIPTPMVIESFGSTSLMQIGSNYFLFPNGGSSGPEVELGGTPIAASSQAGAWVPIGAEVTASGYEIAWKVIGADQYAVWNTDSNGSYVSTAVGTTSGSSVALESIETSFHQDLNGDGVIGIPTTVIESFGSTSLVEGGSNYFLYPNGGSSGPEVKYGGTPIAASSQAGAWAPIGAEATANGYEIAWKVIGADQYAVWNADSNGNYVSTAVGTTSGSSVVLESIETSFHQDLNGDGVIGVPAATSVVQPASSSAPQASVVPAAISDSFVFRGDPGLDAVTNPRNPDMAKSSDHSSLIANQSAASWLHEQTSPPSHVLFQVNDGHDLVGNHDHLKQIADLHASAVFIH